MRPSFAWRSLCSTHRKALVMKQGGGSNCHVALSLPMFWCHLALPVAPASSLREALYGPGQAPRPQSPCPTSERLWGQNEIMCRGWGKCSNSIQLLGQVLLFVLLDRFIVIYTNLNIYKDVLPFRSYMFYVPHIVTGPLWQVSERAI